MSPAIKKLTEKRRIGEVLVEKGWISQEIFLQSLGLAREKKIRIGEALISLGLINETQMAEALAEQYGLPFIDLASVQITEDLLILIPEKIARQYNVIPIRATETTITIALHDPLNLYHLTAIKNLLVKEILPTIAPKNQIMNKIDISYANSTRSIYELAANVKRNISAKAKVVLARPVETRQAVPEEDSSVRKLVDSVIDQAVKKSVSDIHIEPGLKHVSIRQRIDGVLYEFGNLDIDVYSQFLSRLKIMGGLDISEKRKSQDGSFTAKFGEKMVDFRISSLPTIHGEKIVIRVLDQAAQSLELSSLGFDPENVAGIKSLLERSRGLILITGPTGSGKTTTIYSMLKAIDAKANNIVTIEDPVEFQIENLNQVQVNSKAGMTFAYTLRGVLRQDPDVIMVGEIRDGETGEITVRAALTGHLVISSLHTNDALGTIHRLIDIEVPAYLISSALSAVISQRLVRKLCPKCKVGRALRPVDLVQFKNLRVAQETLIYEPVGCPECNGVGYRGREAIFEILYVTEATKKLIGKSYEPADIEMAIKEGSYIPMYAQAVKKLLLGETSLEEVLIASS